MAAVSSIVLIVAACVMIAAACCVVDSVLTRYMLRREIRRLDRVLRNLGYLRAALVRIDDHDSPNGDTGKPDTAGGGNGAVAVNGGNDLDVAPRPDGGHANGRRGPWKMRP